MGRMHFSAYMSLGLIIFLFAAVCFLAYSNGANDNFKGVATLFGSKTASYQTALTWATITTAAGSLTAIFLAQSLLRRFSGKGLVPDTLTTDPAFLLAVALGAGITVIVATVFGFPISTTHGITGALVGAGMANGFSSVNFTALGASFFLPLLLSPILAIAVGSAIYLSFRTTRRLLKVEKEFCVCVGTEPSIPIAVSATAAALEPSPHISVSAGTLESCQQRYTGTFLGFTTHSIIDALHFLSAGAVSFARGLNDTPKIAALLLVATALRIEWTLIAVGVAMAVGGLLNAKKVAATMSTKITDMNTGQGFAANLATALLVNTASYHGLPVSTTHVSVGSLLGIGITTGSAKWKPVLSILASWVVTLPTAAFLSALAFLLLKG